MDLRVSKALGTSQGFWYRMQAQWDMAQAKRRFKAKVKAIPPGFSEMVPTHRIELWTPSLRMMCSTN